MQQGQTDESEGEGQKLSTGPRIYVIGDLHGCEDECVGMLDFLEYSEDVAEDDSVIFIGDYIDRGPKSFGVVEEILKFRARSPATVRCLRGNHEEMLLSFLDRGGFGGEAFLVNGGDKTLESYRINPRLKGNEAAELLPKEHLEFYTSLERLIEIEGYIFAHAGLHPLYSLEDQRDEDLFWIRDEFIANVHKFGKTIVFGHTPFQDVMIDLPYKIGIDTGVVYGNALTCVELTGELVFQIPAGTDDVECFRFEDKLATGLPS